MITYNSLEATRLINDITERIEQEFYQLENHDSDKIDEIVSLSFIKDSKLVRALILLIILFIGIFSYRNNNTFRILDTKYYDVEYNKKNKEYYVISNKDNIKLNIYSPKNIIKVNMSHYDKNDEKIDSESISSDGNLKITSSNGDYYIVEGVKRDKSKEIIKIYFYIESK